MQLALWFHTFVTDDKVKAILVLIAVDLILGVAAAFYTKTFRLSYLANFARDDVLAKVVPYFVLYAAALVAGHVTILGPYIDFGALAMTAFGIVVAAIVASILGSLKQLGVLAKLSPYFT